MHAGLAQPLQERPYGGDSPNVLCDEEECEGPLNSQGERGCRETCLSIIEDDLLVWAALGQGQRQDG
jgi:hypothetical protein